jgi:hypothetical protein
MYWGPLVLPLVLSLCHTHSLQELPGAPCCCTPCAAAAWQTCHQARPLPACRAALQVAILRESTAKAQMEQAVVSQKLSVLLSLVEQQAGQGQGQGLR